MVGAEVTNFESGSTGSTQSGLFFKKNIYLFILAALGLSYCMQDLSLQHGGSLLRHAGFSLVVAPGLSSCGVPA